MTIQVENLSKTYGSFTAIEDVNFTVETGEILGFLGPNGAGKTTTMRILAGYLPATSGTAKVAGYDVHTQSLEVRKRIGYLPESPPLYPDMTVEGFLNFVASIKGVKSKVRKARVDKAIARCKLVEKRKLAIRKLSKGYKQRVGIAQAIVHEPPVVILDEPTSGLDPRQIIEVRNLIKSLAGEHTIILSSHILPEVSAVCDRVTIINRGKIVATNSPTSLIEQLSATNNYHLELGGDFTTVSAVLQEIPEIASFSLEKSLNERQIIAIHSVQNTEPGNIIAQKLIAAGIPLWEMRRTHASLEDVFLELTTEEINIKDVVNG